VSVSARFSRPHLWDKIRVQACTTRVKAPQSRRLDLVKTCWDAKQNAMTNRKDKNGPHQLAPNCTGCPDRCIGWRACACAVGVCVHIAARSLYRSL
jgi:hypothetical protein